MKLFGLTGGIASGKSTVSKMFMAAGVPVIDADLLAREVVAPGTEGLRRVAERFPGVLAADGSLDRKKLGERIFGDSDERAALNAIVHPLVRALALERTTALAERGEPIAIYDAPLLLENRLHEGMNGVVLVACDEAVQVARMQQRDGFTEAQARARIAAQMPLAEKKKSATWIIDNGGTLEATQRQVDHVIAAMKV